MFYDFMLLQPQHRARLHCAWLAATRGVGFLNKKIVVQADLEAMCQELQAFICSQSESPRERFSLRLSSILINGVVKINNQKATYVWDEVCKIMTAVTSPASTTMLRLGRPSTREIGQTPPTPTIAKKGKKRQPKDTPETDLEGLLSFVRELELQSESEPIVQARVDDITLRDSQIPAIRHTVDGEGEEFGPGLFGLEELKYPSRLAVIQEISSLGIEPLPQSPRIEKATSLHVPDIESGVRRMTMSSPEEVAPIFTVEAMVHAPASLEQQEPRIDVIQPDIREEVPITVLREIQPQETVQEKARKRGKKKVVKKDKNLLKKIPKRVVKIDRSETDEECMVQIKHPLEFRLKPVNFSELLKKYAAVQEVPPIAALDPLETPPATVPTRRSTGPSIQQPPIPQIEVIAPLDPSVEQQLPLITSTPSRGSTGLSIQQALSSRPEVFESPRKRRRLESVPPQASGPLELLSLPVESGGFSKEIPTLQPTTVESELLPLTDQQRQQDIVNKIAIEGRKTLEQICGKPINRLNIARAFNDVLVLCGRNYVTLVTEENSTELKFIDKGPRMTD